MILAILYGLYVAAIFFVHIGLAMFLRWAIVASGDEEMKDLATNAPFPLLVHIFLFIVAFFISTGVVLTVYFILEIL